MKKLFVVLSLAILCCICGSATNFNINIHLDTANDSIYYIVEEPNSDGGVDRSFTYDLLSISLPRTVLDYNLDKFNRCVYTAVTGDSIYIKKPSKKIPSSTKAIVNYFETMGALAYEDNYRFATKKQIKGLRENEYPFCVPTMVVNAKFKWYDEHTNVGCVEIFTCTDMHSGLGAGYTDYSFPLLYDFENDRRVYPNEIIKPETSNMIVKEVRKYFQDHMESLCLTADYEESIYNYDLQIDVMHNIFNVVYPKYQVACGAAGNIMVPITAISIDHAEWLTPFGRKLMGKGRMIYFK